MDREAPSGAPTSVVRDRDDSQGRTPPGAGFNTTLWPMVLSAGRGGAREALSALCQAYWYPVFSFLRGLGLTREDAEDVTQGFFAGLLRRGDLARVSPERGRFRNWLRSSARHHWLNELARRHARKRRGPTPPVSIDSDPAALGADLRADDALSPDRIFDRQWALTVVARALARLRKQYQDEGRGEVFARLHGDLAGDDPAPEPPRSARAAGRTPVAIRVARHRLKKEMKVRYRRCLRAEIAETVTRFEAIDDEMRDLFDALS